MEPTGRVPVQQPVARLLHLCHNAGPVSWSHHCGCCGHRGAGAQGGTSSGGSAAVGFAVISGPGKDEQVATGKPYTITWTPDATHMGNIAIYLLGGHDPSTLQMLRTISGE